MNTWRNSLALAVTAVLFYALCTLTAAAFPDQFLVFMNSLFHGLDFRILKSNAAFDWRGFCLAAAVMFLWTLAFAAVFQAVAHWLAAQRLSARRAGHP
ncbi:hypothetical protein E4L96_19775 [Massilia arenosa]|uniref:Uncharacterized protein n=1 Tax=Zemynaea arenosa TaxID=2561931 RepID=A0A4Y9RW17_9BURK|nr:DUF5676 family membrane protein [Massilia arenosa]TFW13340.1 hypothetical protein E4L96_19775 [Massilia arenosa]